MPSGNTFVPSLSVLMPAHNAEKTIKLALRSALIAAPRDGEIICLLDACSDETRNVVESFTDPRIRLIVSSENLGVKGARARLLELARSPYVANLDADDIVLPWHFKKQLKVLERGKASIVFANAILFGPAIGRISLLPQWPVGLNGNQCDLALVFSNPFINSSMVAKKEALLQLGGFDTMAEDYGLWLKASSAGTPMLRLAGYGVLYRVHPGQLTRSIDWQTRFNTDEGLSNLKTKHFRSIQDSYETASGPPQFDEIWDVYSHSSFALAVQNVGIKKLCLGMFAKAEKRKPRRKGASD